MTRHHAATARATSTTGISTSRPLTVDEIVHELTRPHQHQQLVTTRTGKTRRLRHRAITVPALVDQLEHANPSSRADMHRGGGYESTPVARIENLDTLTDIRRDARTWLRHLDADTADLTGTTTDLVTRLARHLPHRDVEHDLRRWHTRARIVIGWDDPPWRPDATCPVCAVNNPQRHARRDTLRVRSDERIALCTDCGTTWDGDAFSVLVEHVRAEADTRDRRRRAATAEPCWCPLPRPETGGAGSRLGPLCPVCGDPRCHRALPPAAAITDTIPDPGQAHP